jgi:CheY-like chemotaxis protein
MNIPEPASGWPSVSELWIGTKGESGSNPSPDGDRRSDSRSPSEGQMEKLPHILTVEDNPGDVFFIRAALQTANINAELHFVKDGEQAIKFFDEADCDSAAPCPTLILLDINLPRKQGGEVLQYMRRTRRCADSLVIAVSSSDTATDREKMKALGANCYFHKPSTYAEFMKLGEMVKELLSR